MADNIDHFEGFLIHRDPSVMNTNIFSPVPCRAFTPDHASVKVKPIEAHKALIIHMELHPVSSHLTKTDQNTCHYWFVCLF